MSETRFVPQPAPASVSDAVPSSGASAVPDDIKIIAQFLAGRDPADAHWTAFTRDAARLRRALKARGRFRLTRGA
ncbi:MAG: hypothetical protein QOJ94_1846 [Sphingomonadales bacterium]|jgi:hypothetical protein|nr:hypothetical protein [Sphingomonadales bacterium]